jgi:hypothetical protein
MDLFVAWLFMALHLVSHSSLRLRRSLTAPNSEWPSDRPTSLPFLLSDSHFVRFVFTEHAALTKINNQPIYRLRLVAVFAVSNLLIWYQPKKTGRHRDDGKRTRDSGNDTQIYIPPNSSSPPRTPADILGLEATRYRRGERKGLI